MTSEQFVIVCSPEEHAATTLATLSPGDALIVPSIKHLADTPSGVLWLLSQAAGKGIHLHAIDLGGPVVGHWLGVMAGLETAAAIEGEVENLRKDMADMEARHLQDIEQVRDDLLQQFLTEGVTLRASNGKGNGHAEPIKPEPHLDLKSIRSKLNLSQTQAAEKLGVGRSTYQRLEAGEEDLNKIISAINELGGGLVEPTSIDVSAPQHVAAATP